jgi:uncharacterized protein
MTTSTKNKTALITGASSGIGYELTQLFARDGYNLVLVARSGQKLIELANHLKEKFLISIKIIEKDLSKSSAPDEVFNELQQENIPIHILVNNAGFGAYGPFSEVALNTELEMMQLNMVTPTHLTKLFLDEMIQRRDGKILNIASTAAFQPGPLMAVYYASKAYILSFSEALANELQGSKVSVTVLCPGPTASNFQQRADLGKSKLLKNQALMDSKTVAELGYQGLADGKALVISGFKNQLLAFVVRFFPRQVITQTVRNMQEKM